MVDVAAKTVSGWHPHENVATGVAIDAVDVAA